MHNEPKQPTEGTIWKPLQTYTMAAVCLVIGVAVGYLVRGSASPAPPPTSATTASTAQPTADPHAGMGKQGMPSLEQMKQMADKQAEPLLAKLKDDSKNPDLLNQIGSLYRVTHQFKTAADYYQKALDIDPKNVGARTDLASCLYYTGDIDRAIAQLRESLKYDPDHAGTLFNLGMIEWQGKGDSKDAIATWEQLLKLHPDYAQKDAVLHLIDVAKQGKPKTTAAVTQ
jgi:cytochrome c-type biogenesis protein CcmH/NrfG